MSNAPRQLGLVHDKRYLDHDTGHGHPERADRLRAVMDRLESGGLLDTVTALGPRKAEPKELARVHSASYIDRVSLNCAQGATFMDSLDTPVCPDSYDVARLAAGGLLAAVDAVMAGDLTRAMCLPRPPGHHAEFDQAMGFCLFNNVAVAAAHLVGPHLLDRVAIVDFDVHHGNGTQHLFETRSDILFCSAHEHPRSQFPGTGFEYETGTGPGEGFTVNVPLMPRTGEDEAKAAFEGVILPKLDAYKPQFLLISAGFDAEADDPLGNLNWKPQTFDWITRRLGEVADKHCGGKIVSTLEGGYDLDSLARCVSVHLEALRDTL